MTLIHCFRLNSPTLLRAETPINKTIGTNNVQLQQTYNSSQSKLCIKKCQIVTSIVSLHTLIGGIIDANPTTVHDDRHLDSGAAGERYAAGRADFANEFITTYRQITR